MVPIEYHLKTPEGVYGYVQQLIYPYVRDDNIFLCPADFSKGEKVRLGPISWKGKKWRISYYYFVNNTILEEYKVTHPFPDMALFYCKWHSDLDIIARYDGRIELAPSGRYRSISIITE
jgi:hypothetical protein